MDQWKEKVKTDLDDCANPSPSATPISCSQIGSTEDHVYQDRRLKETNRVRDLDPTDAGLRVHVSRETVQDYCAEQEYRLDSSPRQSFAEQDRFSDANSIPIRRNRLFELRSRHGLEGIFAPTRTKIIDRGRNRHPPATDIGLTHRTTGRMPSHPRAGRNGPPPGRRDYTKPKQDQNKRPKQLQPAEEQKLIIDPISPFDINEVGPHPGLIEPCRAYVFEHQIQRCLKKLGTEHKDESWRIQGVNLIAQMMKALGL
jgi:hypothetical protein